MRRAISRTAIALTVSISLVGASVAAALACKPMPPAEHDLADEQVDERLEPYQPPQVVRPWTQTDSARVDRMLGHIGALVDALIEAPDQEEAQRAALLQALRDQDLLASDLIRLGEAIGVAFQADQQGASAYLMTRIDAIQRLSERIKTLSPSANAVVTEIFMG